MVCDVTTKERIYGSRKYQRDWYVIAGQQAPAPHLAHPEGRAAIRIVLVAVPRVSRSCEHFPNGFDLWGLSFRGVRCHYPRAFE